MSSRDIDEDSEFDTSNDERTISPGYRAHIPETLSQDLSLRSPDLLDDDDRNTLNPQKTTPGSDEIGQFQGKSLLNPTLSFSFVPLPADQKQLGIGEIRE